MIQLDKRLLKAVAFIESHLGDDVRLASVSREACYSPYHFLRLFHALTGQTAGTYIRRRRLTKAAEALLNDKTRIIEIALEAGFDSQAAFGRAFKEMFGTAPAQFRRKEKAPAFRGQPVLTEAALQHLRTEGITMKPIFERKESFTLIGLGRDFSLTGPNKIGELWDEFHQRKASILPMALDQNAYGICSAPKETEAFTDKFHYTAALRVSPETLAPEGMEKKTLAAQDYAVFTHKGPLETLPLTNDYIWKTWLPQSGLDLADAADIEVYGAKWKDASPESELEIWVPLVRRG